jgi:hypothetical protein
LLTSKKRTLFGTKKITSWSFSINLGAYQKINTPTCESDWQKPWYGNYGHYSGGNHGGRDHGGRDHEGREKGLTWGKAYGI